MRPGGVVSFKKIGYLKFLGKNKLLFFMLFLFIFGFVLGNALFNGSSAAEISKLIFNYYLAVRNNSFIRILFPVMFEYLFFAILLFAAGTSLTGVIVSPLICCSAGMYFGALVSFTYSTYAIKGIAFNSVILIPPALLFIMCMLFAATEAFRFSSVILKTVFPKSRPVNLSDEFRFFCGKYALYTVFALFAAIIDAVVSSAFLKHFSFV